MNRAGFLVFSLIAALSLSGAEFVVSDTSGSNIGLERVFMAAGKAETAALPDDLEIVLHKTAEKSQADAVAAELFPGDTPPEGLAAARIARYPLLIAVSAKNPVQSIPAETLRKIYTGQIKTWESVGNFQSNILRAGAAENSPVGRTFRKLVMKQDLSTGKPPKPGHDILPGVLWLSSPKFAHALAGADNVLIFGGWELTQIPGLKVVAIGDKVPAPENIAGGRYPYIVDHVLLYRKDARPAQLDAVVQYFRTGTLEAGAIPDTGPATSSVPVPEH